MAFPPRPGTRVVVLRALLAIGQSFRRAPYHAVAVALSVLAAWLTWRIPRRLDTPVGDRWWLAFLSRQLCVYLIPFIALAVWLRHAEAGRRKRCSRRGRARWPTACSTTPASGARSTRATRACRSSTSRVKRYGLFHPAYVPFSFFHMFLEGPHFVFGGQRQLPPLHMGELGTSLTVASPFICVALAARGQRPWQVAAWGTVLLTLVHMLHYQNNGWSQVNAQRFSLDFLPLLWGLVAMGARHVEPKVWKPLVAWAIGLNVLALSLMPVLARALRKL